MTTFTSKTSMLNESLKSFGHQGLFHTSSNNSSLSDNQYINNSKTLDDSPNEIAGKLVFLGYSSATFVLFGNNLYLDSNTKTGQNESVEIARPTKAYTGAFGEGIMSRNKYEMMFFNFFFI